MNRAVQRTISVITVAYRSEAYIAAALASAAVAAHTAGFGLEVLVVDNASPDDSADAVRAARPDAIILRSDENVGFGRACNLAFGHATGDLWLLLNPDAEIDSGALGPLVEMLDSRPAVGAAGPRIVGGPQAHSENAGMAPTLRALAAHFLFLNRLIPTPRGPWRGLFIRSVQVPRPVRVDWCGAAVLLVRPEAIREVGGFDPSFFLYGEDVDLGLRLGAAAWESWLVPMATARHAMGGSQPGVSTGWVDGTLAVVRRRSAPRARIAAGIMAVGLAVRALAAGLRRRDPLRARHAATMRSAAARSLALMFTRNPAVERPAVDRGSGRDPG